MQLWPSAWPLLQPYQQWRCSASKFTAYSADVLELLGAHIVRSHNERPVIGAEKIPQLLIILQQGGEKGQILSQYQAREEPQMDAQPTCCFLAMRLDDMVAGPRSAVC